jgi:glycosyltransferase involved in cell wall biosynthesis
MSENMPTVVIANLGCGGHHLKYASMIAEGFHARGYDVIYASDDRAFSSPEYGQYLRKHEGWLRRFSLPSSKNGHLPGIVGRAIWVLRIVLRFRQHAIFLPYLDSFFCLFGMAAAVMRFFGFRFPRMEGILMNCDFTDAGMQTRLAVRMKDYVSRAVLRSGVFSRVILIDDVAFSKLYDCSPGGGMVVCPDPVDDAPHMSVPDARQMLGIPLGARVIGAFGCLSKDKAVDLLAAGFLDRAPRQDEYMLLMGEQETSLREELGRLLAGREEAGRVLIMDRLVSQQELLAGINAVNVVAVTYPYHMGSASFLIRAAAAGKPVLASDVGWIGCTMSTYRLGRTCDVLDKASLRDGLEWAFGSPAGDCPDASVFAAEHTIEGFQNVVCELTTKQSLDQQVIHV